MGEARRRRLALAREKGISFEQADEMIRRNGAQKPRLPSIRPSRFLKVFFQSILLGEDKDGKRFERHQSYRRPVA